MKYEFNVGDYFITRTGETGYIIELSSFGHNQTALLLGFADGKTNVVEYTNKGIYTDDDFILLDEYFLKIGKYDFTNIKIAPLTIITVPMQWDGRDSKLMWDKINEIIRYINNQ